MRPHETLGEWLAHFGLSRLEGAFRDNGIDLDILTSLTDDDLKELGLSIGDRKRVLAALSGLAAASTPGSAKPALPAEAERR
jgi:SAM domain (Sterile alpha motif)